MKLKIKNFRNAPDGEWEGKSIFVSGKNWSWKSNTLYAIERCLFGTIQGRVKGMTALKYWADEVVVEVEFWGKSYDREWVGLGAYIDSKYRSLMFCNLLDQEPAYAKKVIADIVVKDQAKDLLGRFRLWNLDDSIKAVRNEYNTYKKMFESRQSKIEVYQHELAEIQDVSEEAIQERKDRIEELEKEIMSMDKGFDKDKMENMAAWISKYDDEINGRNREIEKLKDKLESIMERMVKIKEQGKTTAWGVCYACWQEIKEGKDEKLAKLREEYSELGGEKGVIEAKIPELKKEIEEMEKAKEEIQNTYNELKKLDTSEKVRELEKELYMAKETLQKAENVSNRRKEYEEKISVLAEEITETNDQELVDAYGAIGPSGKINQLLNEEITHLIDGFEIQIAETNKVTWEVKSVFYVKTEHDWQEIMYNNLSRSQKFMANLLLSSKLLEMDWKSLPLVVDDFEMFDEEHGKKLAKKITGDKIIAKVSDKELEVKVK